MCDQVITTWDKKKYRRVFAQSADTCKSQGKKRRISKWESQSKLIALKWKEDGSVQ